MDRRSNDRLKNPDLSIEYKINGSESIYEVEIINISAGGMCFLRKSVIHTDDILQIKFPFKTRKVILTGRVLRIDGKEVAVKFLNNQDDIERFVETFNKEYTSMKKQSMNIYNSLYPTRITKKIEENDVEEGHRNLFNIDKD